MGPVFAALRAGNEAAAAGTAMVTLNITEEGYHEEQIGVLLSSSRLTSNRPRRP